MAANGKHRNSIFVSLMDYSTAAATSGPGAGTGVSAAAAASSSLNAVGAGKSNAKSTGGGPASKSGSFENVFQSTTQENLLMRRPTITIRPLNQPQSPQHQQQQQHVATQGSAQLSSSEILSMFRKGTSANSTVPSGQPPRESVFSTLFTLPYLFACFLLL